MGFEATVNVFGLPYEPQPTGVVILKKETKTIGVARLINGVAKFKIKDEDFTDGVAGLTAYYAGDKRHAATKSLPIIVY